MAMPKIATQDKEWVTPEVADELLRRDADQEVPVRHEDLLKDLLKDQQDRD